MLPGQCEDERNSPYIVCKAGKNHSGLVAGAFVSMIVMQVIQTAKHGFGIVHDLLRNQA